VCRATRRIRIETFDEDGPLPAVVAAADVDYSLGERQAVGICRTDEHGRAALEVLPGRQIELIASDERGCSDAWVGVVGVAGEEPVARLRLRREALRAFVECDGKPRAGLQAWLDGRRIDCGESDDAGRSELLPVPRVRWRDIFFRYPWDEGGRYPADVTWIRDTTVRFQLPSLPNMRRAVLRIIDEGGRPVKGALVGTQLQVGFGVASQLVSDARGEVEFATAENSEVVVGEIVTRYRTRVLVYAAGFAPQVVDCADGIAELRLALRAPCPAALRLRRTARGCPSLRTGSAPGWPRRSDRCRWTRRRS
jgi:hypothetical protein